MNDVVEIIRMLNAFEITSSELVDIAIKKYNEYISFNTICCLCPFAKDRALELDNERRNGYVRSPLHGVPILIKDNILYKDGTPTSANSYALSDLYPPYNASIMEYLHNSGVVIIGKANQTELSNFMSDNMPSGYGSMYGRVKHPFNEDIDPLGSSTGCSAAVKLGIVPISIGTETNGSLMAPAYRCQVTSFKPSFGRVSKYGIIPVSPSQDTAGPISKTVYGCALIMDIIDRVDPKDITTIGVPRGISYLDIIDTPVKKHSVGFLYFACEYDTYSKIVINKSKEKLSKIGHQIIDIHLDTPYIDNSHVIKIEFKEAINIFLTEIKVTKMKSLKDIIEFNINNSERCLKYGQNILEDVENNKYDINSHVYKCLKENCLKRSKCLEDILNYNNIDILACPLWTSHAPIYGNPSICIPEGIFDNVPKSMIFVSRKYDDHILIRFAHEYQIIDN